MRKGVHLSLPTSSSSSSASRPQSQLFLGLSTCKPHNLDRSTSVYTLFSFHAVLHVTEFFNDVQIIWPGEFMHIANCSQV